MIDVFLLMTSKIFLLLLESLLNIRKHWKPSVSFTLPNLTIICMSAFSEEGNAQKSGHYS